MPSPRPAHDDGTNVLVRFDSIEGRTEKAYQLRIDPYDGPEIWIPKSQVASIDREKGEVWVPLWLAEKKGLEYE